VSRIRVLVVDDAVVVRRMVSDVLAADSEIDVAGTAANGRIALQKIAQVNPDAITLDVEMPEMNGLETLREIRRTHPRLPVIMFSTLTERGAADTLSALALGASDYVTKPANVGSVSAAQQRIREELIPKIKALCRCAAPAAPVMPVVPARPASAPAVPAGAAVAVQVVAIGVSTGGPNALAEVLPRIPDAFPVPILIVQHMPPMFTKLLAERLNAQSRIAVVEARGGERLAPGTAYLAPGDFHLVVERTAGGVRTAVNQAPPENSCRPAVDALFRSVADVFGGHAIAVVLTGMGQDGLRGCERLAERGASVVVQDEASSVVWGMPGFVAKAGLAHAVVPLSAIAGEIVRRAATRSGS
jgi:two-component system chemotaxis response regulator CheB